MEVHKVEISSLVFDPVNARKHDSRNLEAIKGSLTRFGQQKPIVVDAKGVVLAGNGTLAAAKALGWTDIWVKVSDLDTVNASAYSLADNRTAELAEWDDEILQQQLAALELAGFDTAILDFDLPSEEEGGGLDGDYTAKIEAPIYTPKGDKPALSELVDCGKAQQLSDEINSADIPDDVKVYELINRLMECSAGADVEIVMSVADGYSSIVTTDFFVDADDMTVSVYAEGYKPDLIKKKK